VKKVVLAICAAVASAFAAEPITSGAKLFIAPMNGGFETAISAAIMKKNVPVTIVADQAQADYVLEGASETQKAGWAKIMFAGDLRSSEEASIRVINAKTSAVVFAYQVNKSSSFRGKQSSSESCAKHLKKYIERK